MHDDDDFAAALAAFEAEQTVSERPAPKVGEKIKGTILSIGREYAFIETGGKSESSVARSELCDAKGELLYQVGDSLEALISGVADGGGLILRVKPGREAAMVEELRAAHTHRMPVEGLVTGLNKGGAEVEIAGHRAFCPISQMANYFVEDANVFLGQRLQFRITRFEDSSPGKRLNLVLSRRVLMEEEAAVKREATLAQLEVGAILPGTISSVTSYGAFVDLGGIEGLLHVSEMSYSRIEDPNEVVKPGQSLKVQIKSIEPAKKGDGQRISLSIRTFEPDPWDNLGDRFPVGSNAEGRVTRLEKFGAFVELAPGVEGLVHISEIGAEKRLNHASEALTVGETVRVSILSIDLVEHRLSLSMAAFRAQSEASQEAESKAEFEKSQESQSETFGSMASFFEKVKKKP